MHHHHHHHHRHLLFVTMLLSSNTTTNARRNHRRRRRQMQLSRDDDDQQQHAVVNGGDIMKNTITKQRVPFLRDDHQSSSSSPLIEQFNQIISSPTSNDGEIDSDTTPTTIECIDTPNYTDIYGNTCDTYKNDYNYPLSCIKFGNNDGEGIKSMGSPNENCCVCIEAAKQQQQLPWQDNDEQQQQTKSPTMQPTIIISTTQQQQQQPEGNEELCIDTPNYTDIYGDNCAYYASPANYPQACQYFGTIATTQDGMSMSPNENCCACQELLLLKPSSSSPSLAPVIEITIEPTTEEQSITVQPTLSPQLPSLQPSLAILPTSTPSLRPLTSSPTTSPIEQPTLQPTSISSQKPSSQPSLIETSPLPSTRLVSDRP